MRLHLTIVARYIYLCRRHPTLFNLEKTTQLHFLEQALVTASSGIARLHNHIHRAVAEVLDR
jgi:hypothetical protein